MKYIYLSLFSLLLVACSGTKHLKDGQYLLGKQSILFEEKVDVPKPVLESMQKQRRNNKLFFMNVYVPLYYLGKKHFDTLRLQNKINRIREKYAVKLQELHVSDSVGLDIQNLDLQKKNVKKYQRIIKRRNKQIAKKEKKIEEGNFLMRLGEEVVVFNQRKAEQSAKKMENYLKTIGYFQSEVTTNVKEIGRKKELTYRVKSGFVYRIDSLDFQIQDESIRAIIRKSKNKSLIQKGEVYEQDKLRLERERVANLLYDNGYFNFKKSDIIFFVDSTKGNSKVWIRNQIKVSNENGAKIYKVDSVHFIINSESTKNKKLTQKEYKGVNFHFHDKNYRTKPLELRTLVKPEQKYSKSLTYNTQSQLGNLDAFRFVRIDYDTLSENSLVARIYATPQKRFQANTSIGLDFTETTPGPYINLGLKNRNFFKGLEILQLNFRYGLEGTTVNLGEDDNQVVKSKSLGTSLSLQFPRFLFLFSESLNSKFKFVNAKTTLSINHNYLDRPDFFTRRGTNVTLAYSWRNKKNNDFILKLAEIGVIDSELSSTYDKQLRSRNNGRLIYNDSILYSPSFIASTTLISNFKFNFDQNKLNRGAYLRLLLESGGAWLNWLGRDVFKKKDLTYYQYLKLEVDFRKYFYLGWNTTFAVRVNNGIAYGYGKNKVVPLEKGFILGGIKMRGWGYGQIGPGSYSPAADDKPEIRNGTLQLYTSAELRQHLFGNLGMTFFVDAGNIWNVHKNESYKNGEFEFSRFHEEFAVSAGYSLNMNISQLILYLGVGMQLRDPKFEKSKRWIYGNEAWKWDSLIGKTNSQIFLGIGYTF